jgi:hypothetical protein
MVTTPDPESLRDRARALRALATRLDQSVLTELPAAGGDDTWRGATASAFQADARRAERMRVDAVTGLRRCAADMDSHANEIDGVRGAVNVGHAV